MPPRTIDSLGVDTSTRYAQDQKILDQKLIKEARSIPPQTEIDSTTIFYPSELDQLFSMDQRGIVWGEVDEPPLYAEQTRRIFTSQIVPSLGSEEKREKLTQRIHAIAGKQESESKRAESENYDFAWQKAQLKTQRDTEAKKLEEMFATLHLLEKDYSEITSYRSQYQKG